MAKRVTKKTVKKVKAAKPSPLVFDKQKFLGDVHTHSTESETAARVAMGQGHEGYGGGHALGQGHEGYGGEGTVEPYRGIPSWPFALVGMLFLAYVVYQIFYR